MSTSTAANKAPPAKAPRPRPYRDFLTPLLHSNIAYAVFLTTCLTYAEAVFMGEWLSPSDWVSLAVVRALCLIVSSLLVFVLRMAELHLGTRNTVSPLETFWKHCAGIPAFRIILLYWLSAFAYLQTYVWFGPSDMGMVDPGRAHERDRINERSVYMRCIILFALPLVQTALHLYYGYDTLELPVSTKPQQTEGKTLAKKIPINLPMLARCGIQAAATTVIGTIAYWNGMHSLIWRLQYSTARALFLVPTQNSPKTMLLGELTSVIWRSFVQGTSLIFLWSWINTLFNVYVSQPPLKKDLPITNDSKDPNGSLLAGLKSKNDIAKTFAFWELAMITERFEARRKTIFEEVDRRDGTTLKQIVQACLAEVNAITKRIEATKPPAPVVDTKTEEIERLPKISSNRLVDENIFSGARAPTSSLDMIGNFARSHGSSKEAPAVSPKAAVKYIEYGTDKVAAQVLPPDYRAKVKSRGFMVLLTDACAPLIRAPYIGQVFRQTFRRRANTVVSSTPYSKSSVIINAVAAITELAVKSIKEDIMGQLSKEVPVIVRALSSAISNIETFLKTLAPHWTDVDFKEADRNMVPEVEELIAALRDGLKKIMIAHGEYLETEGLTRAEIRDVKALLAAKPEMAEAR